MVKEAVSTLKNKSLWTGALSAETKRQYTENAELAFNAFLTVNGKEGERSESK